MHTGPPANSFTELNRAAKVGRPGSASPPDRYTSAMTRRLSLFDRFLADTQNALGTVFGRPGAERVNPAGDTAEVVMQDDERRHAAGLMRINHVGEVCAQALYVGQASVARDPATRAALMAAAAEETDHLAWCAERLEELDSRPSLLNPVWYAGSLAIGAVAGALGDRWNLAFLAETERQVEEHLTGHLDRLPIGDERTRAIVEAMRDDEAKHRMTAVRLGAAELPAPVRAAMRFASKVMTTVAYRV